MIHSGDGKEPATDEHLFAPLPHVLTEMTIQVEGLLAACLPQCQQILEHKSCIATDSLHTGFDEDLVDAS